MSRTVFAIEQGCYSDYHVVGVYTTRDAAEAICARINAKDPYEKATVDEWPLDPGLEAINAGHDQYRVVMLRDGAVEAAERQDASAYSIGGEQHIWRRSQAPAYRGKGVPDALVSVVWAETAAHAIKIVNERRGQMIAMGEWEDAA